VVYGDIGKAPLYVYSSTFTDGIKDTKDVLGVLSLVIYTLTLIPLLKYIFIVLWANINGDGELHISSSVLPHFQSKMFQVKNFNEKYSYMVCYDQELK